MSTKVISKFKLAIGSGKVCRPSGVSLTISNTVAKPIATKPACSAFCRNTCRSKP